MHLPIRKGQSLTHNDALSETADSEAGDDGHKTEQVFKSVTVEEPLVLEYEQHKHLLPDFVQIHIDCIEQDKTIATFLPPLDRGAILDYWKAIVTNAQVNTTIVQLRDGRLAGYVVLHALVGQTGPFRADVRKLLVSPNHRRLGIARRLMQKLEVVAEAKGLTLLTLDTETESPANSMYPLLGYTEIGVVPMYGISPRDGRLMDETFYYKLLPSHKDPWDRPT